MVLVVTRLCFEHNDCDNITLLIKIREKAKQKLKKYLYGQKYLCDTKYSHNISIVKAKYEAKCYKYTYMTLQWTLQDALVKKYASV